MNQKNHSSKKISEEQNKCFQRNFYKELVPKPQKILSDNSLKFLIKCSSSYKLDRIGQFTNFRAVLILLNFRGSSHIVRFWDKLKIK
ncbi:hypothetical protein FFZ99_15730 [Leptospira interrogans]|nr:hypothetical protein BRAT_14160 [Leptospira interrogans serovar Bratislava]KYZ62646.1 hypothetical protein AWU66_12665 [Leptospira interrogans serovar Pomona]TQE52405.1 hypothetical protein FF006_18640 [Leptospira interrogans]TQE61491.1 hypothetical protein FFZ99_15730 [Leptospira interrogans]TQE65142.1 hypothetical protein FF001_14865 [Leptospira interrogans]